MNSNHSSGLLCPLTRRENDFIYEEEYHHGDAAVQNCRSDVVDPVRHQQSGHRHPDAVNGVHHTGHDAEGDDVPQRLIRQVSVTPEHQISLDREVDALPDHHGGHVGTEVRQASVQAVIADDIPFEGLPEQGQGDPRKAEVNVGKAREHSRQEQQHQILAYRDQIADDDEESSLSDPFCCLRMCFRKALPKILDCAHTLLPLTPLPSWLPSGSSLPSVPPGQ